MENLETIIAHYSEVRKEQKRAVVPPIYQTSLFTFDSYEDIDEAFSNTYENSIYTRGNNPTVRILENKIAKLAGGENCKFFASGMAAISSAIMHYIKFNDHAIVIKNTYGPTNNFFNRYLKDKMNVDVTFVEGDSLEEIKNAIKNNTKLIYLESPSTAIFKLQDISEITKIAKEHNIKTIIDNSFSTFVYQRPLELGVDLEVHSASKYISGHSDVIAGCIIGKDSDIKEIYNEEHALFGGILSPFDAWLILRGLRTLPLRLKQHSINAIEVAKFLEKHNKVNKVNYVGLDSFPQKEIAKKQMLGYSGLMSFEIDTDVSGIKRFLNSLSVFSIGVSWGGFESLAFAPIIAILKEMPEDLIPKMGIKPGVVRISVGLENYNSLIEDLDNALKNV